MKKYQKPFYHRIVILFFKISAYFLIPSRFKNLNDLRRAFNMTFVVY